MRYRYLDMENYKRKEHFAYFNSLAYPYVGLTANVDITELLREIKTKGWPFFLTLCYCACEAANQIPEFRQRIIDGKIAEFDRCATSHTVALENGTFCYCTLESDLPFSEYLPYAIKKQEEAKQAASIAEEKEEAYSKFFISSLPWISYTALIQPVPMPADSNPRITWGKYFSQDDRIWLPVSVLCHHALVDGRQIADFYRLLEEKCKELCQRQD